MKNVVAVIPARGGSKRIPGKNVRPFCGKPIIAYSLLAAKASDLFDHIICSTDSGEIAELAKQYGAEVPFQRPAELSNDYASTDAVVVHALQWLADHGQPASYACCLYATAPFVQVEHLQKGFDALLEQQAACVFPVTTYPYTIFRSLKRNEMGRVEWIWPENRDKRSQDFPEAFHDAGQFYWVDVQRCLEAGRIPDDDAFPIVIPRHLVQDIDTQEDWDMAERLYRDLSEKLKSDMVQRAGRDPQR
jgi:pseudaminic acid cytidylyltransferase